MSYTVDPEYICQVKKPKDFETFWKRTTDKLMDVPLEPEMYADPLRSSPTVEVFRVFYNSLDKVKISAWYAITRKAIREMPGI